VAALRAAPPNAYTHAASGFQEPDMADAKNLMVEISDIGKVAATDYQLNPFQKTLSVTKVVDRTSHMIAKWHDDVVLRAGGSGFAAERDLTLTQLDAKRVFELCSIRFRNVQPQSFSLIADPGKKAGVQKTIETLVLTYDKVEIKLAPASTAAALSR
jgi:hypothetical protein